MCFPFSITVMENGKHIYRYDIKILLLLLPLLPFYLLLPYLKVQMKNSKQNFNSSSIFSFSSTLPEISGNFNLHQPFE